MLDDEKIESTNEMISDYTPGHGNDSGMDLCEDGDNGRTMLKDVDHYMITWVHGEPLARWMSDDESMI